MCGIAAIIGFNQTGTERLSRIDSCIPLLKHRGPDKQQVIRSSHFAMAHARLSIIDLSEASNQPFTSQDGRYSLVYNGEIFNYKNLRAELEQEGYMFHTQGDAEVLITLYKAYGKKGLLKINGFFAFLLYDKAEARFFAARDRYGVKPFYFYSDTDYFACASELRSLKQLTDSKRINKTALFTYLQLSYVPEAICMLEGVEKLGPGECIQIIHHQVIREKYYTLDIAPAYREKPNLNTDFLQLLDSAVEERLTADVPVGSFLSGGIDSSIITALAAQKTNDLQTFSIGFKDNPYLDESRFAELVAKKYRTQHHTFYMDEAEAGNELENFLRAMDEPFADSSAFNVFVLAKKTKAHVKVVLSGDGADELFAGYNKHRAEWVIRNQQVKTRLFQSLSLLTGILPASRKNSLSNKIRQLRRFSDGAALSPKERYWRWACFYEENQAKKLISLSTKELVAFNKLKDHYTAGISEDYNSLLLADMNLILPGDMLTKVDRMSMANALEVRNPFLDYRLVEFAFSLGANHKINGHQQKKLIKESCVHLLPDEILNRKKHGFETPVQKWLQGILRDKVATYCLDKNFIETQNLFDYASLKQVVEQAMQPNAGDATALVWNVLLFNFWYKHTLQ